MMGNQGRDLRQEWKQRQQKSPASWLAPPGWLTLFVKQPQACLGTTVPPTVGWDLFTDMVIGRSDLGILP